MSEISLIGSSTKIVDEQGVITYFGPTGTVVLNGELIRIKTDYFERQLNYSDISNRYEQDSVQAYCDYIVENNLIVNQADAEPPITREGIVYNVSLFEGVTTSSDIGSEGWLLANGYFDQATLANPLNYAQLDYGSPSPFFTLVSDNVFGNKNRFTALDGSQNFTAGLFIDHYRNLMVDTNFRNNAGSWQLNCSSVIGQTYNGYDDWFVMTRAALESFFNAETYYNYSPFNQVADLSATVLFSSTEAGSTTAFRIFSSQWGPISKTSTGAGFIICRKMY